MFDTANFTVKIVNYLQMWSEINLELKKQSVSKKMYFDGFLLILAEILSIVGRNFETVSKTAQK